MKRFLPLAAFLLLAPGDALAAERRGVVLVTLDTTRADRMGFLGGARGLTPELDLFAARSIVFERAYSQAPITTASHATILSGTYPQFHRVNDFGVPLPASVPWLPETLQGAGYATGAFVASLILDPRGGLAPGFDRGFDTYDAGFRVTRRGENRYQTIERRGAEVVDRALAWLDGIGGRPFLLWVHLYDAHDPYDPPPPFAARFARAPYDGEIAYVDACVGRLLTGLRARRLEEDSVVAILADHGESLGEHGESTHGVYLYDATIHVPLLLKLPSGRGAGQRVTARAGLVDLAPTILESVGVARPPAMQGESLVALLGAKAPPDRAVYSETDYPQRAFGWSALASWRVDRFLFVRAPERELYDVSADPAAGKNLAGERGLVAERIQEQMDAFRRRTAASDGTGAASRIDPELAEKLASLGYVGSGGTSPASGIDPKSRIAVANALHEAILAVESGDNARATPLLEKVVASDPQIYMAEVQLGIALARQRQFARAIPALRKAIELLPDSHVAHYEMGLALFETGDLKTAAAHFEIVTKRLPKWADARFSLGSVYARIGRLTEADTELRAALELEPKHYRANLLLGRLLDLQGRSAEGLPYLQRAAEANPSSAEAQTFLADAFTRLGRGDEAARARSRAADLAPRPAP